MLKVGDKQPKVLAPLANDPVIASAPGARTPVIAAWERLNAEGPAGIAVQVIEPATGK